MSEIIKWIVFALGGILVYLLLVLATILDVLRLNPRALDIVERTPQAGWVVGGVVFLAGVSTLLGESAILFINRVRRGRFIVSLITNGIVFLISYAVWGLTVYVIGRILFEVNPPLGEFIRMVGLSTAPLVFGFLILIPWMGPFIAKVLNVWSLLILLVIVEHEFQIGFWPAALCVALGWLVSLGFSNTIGRPVVALRNKLFQMVTGTRMDSTVDDLLLHFSGAGYDELLDIAPELLPDPQAVADPETVGAETSAEPVDAPVGAGVGTVLPRENAV